MVQVQQYAMISIWAAIKFSSCSGRVLQLISLPKWPYYKAPLQSIDNLVIYKLCLKDANANANARTGKEKQPLIA